MFCFYKKISPAGSAPTGLREKLILAGLCLVLRLGFVCLDEPLLNIAGYLSVFCESAGKLGAALRERAQR